MLTMYWRLFSHDSGHQQSHVSCEVTISCDTQTQASTKPKSDVCYSPLLFAIRSVGDRVEGVPRASKGGARIDLANTTAFLLYSTLLLDVS
jgi:hypothetical protein